MCVISILSIPYNQNAFMLQMKDASLQPVPCSTRGTVQPYTVGAAAVDIEMQSEAAEVEREMQSVVDGEPSGLEAAAVVIEMQPEAAEVERKMQSAVDGEPSGLEAAAVNIEMQSEAAEVDREMQSEAAAVVIEMQSEAAEVERKMQSAVAGIIFDQCSQVVGEVYALPLTFAQHDNQLVLAYSPLDNTVATENAGAEIQIQPLSSCVQ